MSNEKTNNKIIIINGPPEAGKDGFCTFVSDMGIYQVLTYRTSDLVKKAAGVLGWNGEKTPKDRKFISDLHDLAKEAYGSPLKNVISNVDVALSRLMGLAIVIHAREPEDIKALAERYPDAITVFVYRPDMNVEDVSNHADANVFEYAYDHIITNDGTLVDYKKKVDDFILSVVSSSSQSQPSPAQRCKPPSDQL